MADHATTPVSLRDEDGIAVVTLDDGKVNALSIATMDVLEQTVAAAAETAGAIVLAGRPGMFSAGLDLKAARSDDPEDAIQIGRRLERLLGALAATPAPVVAACTGHAIAGGALVLLTCAYRVGPADDSFKIGLTETSIGLSLPDYAVQYASARLERRFFLRATALAEVLTPAAAVEWGFLDEVAPADTLVDTAVGVARRLRDGVNRRAFARTKKLVLGT